MIFEMRKQLVTFNTHIKTEETMSKLYQHQQNFEDFDNQEYDGEDEDMLL
jgi:hypothetical protein